MNEYKTTTSFEKIVTLQKPVRIVQGGKGCSKTISILQLFIFLAMSERKNLILSIVAESLPNLKSGALRDFDKLLKSMGLYSKFKINHTDKTYTFGSNVIEFFSVDGESSRLGSRRTHLYINEADNIKFSTYLELQGRTSEFTILDFNPRRKFWAHTELKGQEHVDFLQLNYTHNEYIPKGELESILWYRKKAETGNPFWVNKWRVLGLGELGIADGVIFENWTEIKELPQGAKYLGAGLDFGYSNDPTAITKIYKYEDKIILVESLYKKGILNSAIAKHIMNDNELYNGLIICDSSEPKTIAELRTYGISIMGVRKGKGSIISGIQIMQEYDLLLLGKNLIEEFENYTYQKDRSGESTGQPIDNYNHAIDGTRYFFMERLAKSASNYNTLRWVS
ncbi:PBSX family phage terminase large subunit [Psychroserpens mesophilus]|uniref:PBSX family phage terminase large subunit n=1 Tax=Psychroserpens mesophilus TaxID=325473 RepID=UPI003D658745